MTDREVMQQALKALESGLAFDTHSDVLQNLRAALAMHEVSEFAQAQEQQAEPVALWQKRHPLRTEGAWKNTNEHDAKWWSEKAQGWEIRALYTTPPQRQWDKPSASFNAWWDSYCHDPANPFAEGSAAYWAWAGWKAAQRQWVGLTDEEIHRTTVLLGFNPEWKTEIGMAHAVVRNLETKLKERNND